MNKIRNTILGMALTMLTALAGAPCQAAGADELPAPPYLVSRAHLVIAALAFDEAVIKSLLPSGVQASPGGTGGIILYGAQESYGLPPYSGYWMWADVEGYDSATGIKGRWMLAGAYSPAAVANAWVKYFSFPVREGLARVEWSGSTLRGTGSMGGKEFVRIDLVRKSDPCQRVSGTMNAVARNGSGQNQIHHVPYVGDFCLAESAQVEVSAPSSDVFGKLKTLKVLWAGELRDGAFAEVPGR